MEVLGRKKFGDEFKDLGDEILKSYVKPRFCNDLHPISSEKKKMSKKILTVFPTKKVVNRKKNTELKDKEKVLDVLAAGIIKLTTPGSEPHVKMQELQITDAPGLIADSPDKPFKKEYNTDLRKSFEKEYSNSFKRPTINPGNTVHIRDSMQDILLCPLKHHVRFCDYFNLFWELKIKPSLYTGSVVVIDFDRQRREPAPKDITRTIRDNTAVVKNKKVEIPMHEIRVSDDDLTPSQEWTWGSFLKNRENKANLVLYLCEKLSTSNARLYKTEVLYVSFQGKLVKVKHDGSAELPLTNNHDESDTRIFHLVTLFEYKDIVIRSTDSDLLAIALLNNKKLELNKRTISIDYGTDHCILNLLVQSIFSDCKYSLLVERNIPVVEMVAALHFITGSDDLSYLRGFSKDFCYKQFLQHSDIICGTDAQICKQFLNGDVSATELVFRRLLVILYLKKYGTCFSSDDATSLCAEALHDSTIQYISEKTWYKTVVTNNQMLSPSAINLHCKRIFVFNILSKATNAELEKRDLNDNGWKVVIKGGKKEVTVVWDTEATASKMNTLKKEILRKCRCEKTRCVTNNCSCKRMNKECTGLCICKNCGNTKSAKENQEMPISNDRNDIHDENPDIQDTNDDDTDNDTSDDAHIGDDTGDDDTDNDNTEDEDISDYEKDSDFNKMYGEVINKGMFSLASDDEDEFNLFNDSGSECDDYYPS